MTTRKTTMLTDEPPKEDVKEPTIEEQRIDAVNGLFQLGQFACLSFGWLADAGAIGIHGPNISKELVDLADKNSKLASKVDLLIKIGPLAGIIAASVPFVAQILVNHKVVKAEQFADAGVVHPETLEAQMKASLMKQAMEAMQKQRNLEDEMMRMQEEMAESHNGSKDAFVDE